MNYFKVLSLVILPALIAITTCDALSSTIKYRSSFHLQPLLSSTSAEGLETIPPVQLADPNHPLIQLANKIIYTKSGIYSEMDPSVFSEEFVFRDPGIGPLNKADYIKTLGTFGFWKALPDINPNAFGFSVDPKDPNRVWFMVRTTGTFSSDPGLGLGFGQYFPPNGAVVDGCPETFSIVFDDDQKVKHLTVGYVADRFEGNTSGKGAAVGIFNAIGVPYPEPGPLLKFAQWFGTEVLDKGAKAYSKENVPNWWKSEQKGSEGLLSNSK